MKNPWWCLLENFIGDEVKGELMEFVSQMAKMGIAWVLRLTAAIALVQLLEHHGEFELGQHAIRFESVD
jgi:hypothetical protein